MDILKKYHNIDERLKLSPLDLIKRYPILKKFNVSLLLPEKYLDLISIRLPDVNINITHLPKDIDDKKVNGNLELELSNTKKLIDDVIKDKSYINISRKMDYFSMIKYDWSRIYRAQNLTNAWLKFYEMINYYKLIDDSTFLVFDNAAFPGSSILATHHYINTMTNIKNYKWIGSSLLKKGIALDDSYDLYKNYKDNWLMNNKYNGDITDEKVLLYYKSKLKHKVDLYISDLGFDVSEDYNNQENIHSFYNLGQILLGLITLKEGGNFVTKQYTFFSYFSIFIITFLTSLFNEFYISKPSTSKPQNSEIYLVGKRFKGISSENEKFLFEILKSKYKCNLLTTSIFKIVPTLEQYYTNILNLLYIRQIRYIERNIYMFKIRNNKTISEFMEKTIEEEKLLSISKWINNNKLLILYEQMMSKEVILKITTDLDKEYMQLKLTEKLINFVENIIDRDVKDLFFTWFLITIIESLNSELLHIWKFSKIYKFPNEEGRKFLLLNLDENIVNKIDEISRNYFKDNIFKGDDIVYVLNNTYRYKDFSFTTNLKFEPTDIIKCALRYSSISYKKNKFSKSHYEELYRLGVRSEAYVSPFDRNFDGNFYGFFEDVDKIFGSLGIFTESSHGFDCHMRIPSVEVIIKNTISSIVDDYEKFRNKNTYYIAVDKDFRDIITTTYTRLIIDVEDGLIYVLISLRMPKNLEEIRKILKQCNSDRFPYWIIQDSIKFKTIDYSNFKIVDSSIYSCLRPNVISSVNEVFMSLGDIKTIIDGTANIGCDTVNLANLFAANIVAIEKDKKTFDVLVDNIKSFNLQDIIHPINDSYENYNKPADLVYLDPPWGGSDYKNKEGIDLYLSDIPIHMIIKRTLLITKHVVLKVPINFNYNKFVKNINAKVIRKEISYAGKVIFLLLIIHSSSLLSKPRPELKE